MNNLLNLKGNFNSKKNTNPGYSKSMWKNTTINVNDIDNWFSQIENIKNFFDKQEIIEGILINIEYKLLVAKSNRVSKIFKINKKTPNDFVVGARYSDEGEVRHIITYYVSKNQINKLLEDLLNIKKIIKNEFREVIDYSKIDDSLKLNNLFAQKNHNISKTSFKEICADLSYINSFSLPSNDIEVKEDVLISVYKTELDTLKLLETIGINVTSDRMIGDNTVQLFKGELLMLKDNYPWIISMSGNDFNNLEPESFHSEFFNQELSIPSPSSEPTIGVIDTLFWEDVYFSEWVTFVDEVDPNLPRHEEDYLHGTAVTSLIVDGPTFNNELDDGCGNFRVRHFGVSLSNGFSSITIINKIIKIVENNTDIKVWNLSLGSKNEIERNYISPIAEIIDKLQIEKDIIFVISGTNDLENTNSKKIGSPADSINSLIVNSVNSYNEPAKYTRNGLVLDFFIKPDISYYGGDSEKAIVVCSKNGLRYAQGTSYAAPLIARKISYLIDKLGFDRETAKAMIIDSATAWSNPFLDKHSLPRKGYGVVPIHIKEIVNTPKDEIKFILKGTSEKYDTYNYNLPIPMNNGKYPFLAKATMSYFTNVSRSQGVDYTNTELSIVFGRIKDNNTISNIGLYKSADDYKYLFENDARKWFRKWDNVKFIIDKIAENPKPRISYENNKNWGISIKSNKRFTKVENEVTKFSVVISLKEMNGVNRIEDFIQKCSLNGWIVEQIDLEQKISLSNAINKKVEFDI